MFAFFAVMLLVASAAATENGGAADPYGLEGVNPSSLKCDPTGEKFLLLPHETACNKFYTCDNGREVEMICPSTLIFDFKMQVCNWPWATTCTLRNEEVDGSGDYDEGTDEWAVEAVEPGTRPVGNTQQGMQNIPETSVPLSGSTHFEAQINCKSSKNAAQRLANKDDCQRYWRCVDGEINSFFCTDGLFFNEKTQQCDFEANVVCNVNHEHELQGEFMVYKS